MYMCIYNHVHVRHVMGEDTDVWMAKQLKLYPDAMSQNHTTLR